MKKLKIRVFRVELATCLLVPLLILFFIVLVGYGYVGREKGRVMRQVALLDEIPLLESRLVAAQKVLSRFRMINGGKENGEWSHRVSQSAVAKGVAVRTVNTEKMVPQVAVSCNDYRILVSGEGRLASVVGWLDELDQPARCFKVTMLKMRPLKTGFPAGYELESVIHSRSIAMHSQPGQGIVGQIEPILAKLQALTLQLNTLEKTKWQELDTRELDEREALVKETMVPPPRFPPLSLKLNGIVKDEHKPLALTDRGVLGEGDLIDDYRVIRVAADHVVVENGAGQQEVVRLYRTEANP